MRSAWATSWSLPRAQATAEGRDLTVINNRNLLDVIFRVHIFLNAASKKGNTKV
jgi:hypothetical protein